MPDAIKPGEIPGAEILPEVIEEQAAVITAAGASVRDNGSDVHAKWQALAGVYEAPESGLLLDVMSPVGTQATTAGDNLQTLGRALSRFADDVRPIKAELDSLRAQATAFVDYVVGPGVQVRETNPAWIRNRSRPGRADGSGGANIPQYHYVQKEWHEHQESVDRNNELIAAVNAAQVRLWDAERTCANAIRALYGAAPLRAFQSEDDPLGYGLEEIPEGTEMPWGAAVERSEGCGEATFNFVVKDFLWEGIVVGGIWGTVEGLGTLTLGYNPATGDFFSGEAYGAAWGGLGMLVAGSVMNSPVFMPMMLADQGMEAWGGGGFLPQEVRDFKARADEVALEMGKGLIAWDSWQDDPGTALGESVFNVATILIPAGAAVTGVKTAGGAASVMGRMARIVDLVDPAAWAFRGAGSVGNLTLGSIDNLVARLDGTLPHFDPPHVEVHTATDAASAIDMLDDWGVDLGTVTARVDDGVPVLEFPGGAIELPTGAFDDALGSVRGADGGVEVPATVREPELVGAGGSGGSGGTGSVVDSGPVHGGGGSLGDAPSPGGAGTDSGGSGGGGDSGDTPPAGTSANHGGPTDGDVPRDPTAAQPVARAEGPLYSDAEAGPGWSRAPDTGSVDPDYGKRRDDSGTPQPWYAGSEVDNPDVAALVEDPFAPFGRDADGTPIADQADWNSRYTYPDHADGSPGGVRWPANDGAVAGTRVHYDSVEALTRDYPEFSDLDRIGGWRGDYLTVEGTSFEQRGLTPGHRAMEYSTFDLAPSLPTGVRIEVSVVDEALGFPGGGWQIRFFRVAHDGTPTYLSVDELIDLEVLL